jgi:hypothetical protein
VIAVSHRREHLEQGALTIGALATLTAIWLGVGLPGFSSVFSRHEGAANETQLVAYSEDTVQPRPHAAPTIPLAKNDATRRHAQRSAPQLVPATSVTGGRTPPRAPSAASTTSVSPTAAVQPRADHAASSVAAAPTRGSDVAPQQTAGPAEAATTSQTTTTTATTTTQNTTGDTPTPPPPPVTLPSLPTLPDLPNVPDVPLPDVPSLPTLPSPPTVSVPQTPSLPAVEPPQLPPVQTPTQTVPTLP